MTRVRCRQVILQSVSMSIMWSTLPLSALKIRLQVCSRRDLLAAGHTDHHIRKLVATNSVRRLGKHWFGTERTPSPVAAALRRNHRLSCVSALAIHGVYVPDAPWAHEVGRQCSCTSVEGIIEHSPLRSWPDDEPLTSVRMALQHAVTCLDAEWAAIVMESALNSQLIRASEPAELIEHVSLKKQRAIGTIDGRAMSGTETRVRRFMQSLGVQVVPQYEVAGVGRVDMLVGERLVLECDSRGHHTGHQNYSADRRRDQKLTQLGFQVVRLTHADVMQNWDQTQHLLRALIAAGVHRRQQRRGRAEPTKK